MKSDTRGALRRTGAALLCLALMSVAPAPLDACLLAVRLRAVAPHLSEEEVLSLAHGSMTRQRIEYSLREPAACSGGMADIQMIAVAGVITLICVTLNKFIT